MWPGLRKGQKAGGENSHHGSTFDSCFLERQATMLKSRRETVDGVQGAQSTAVTAASARRREAPALLSGLESTGRT